MKLLQLWDLLSYFSENLPQIKEMEQVCKKNDFSFENVKGKIAHFEWFFHFLSSSLGCPDWKIFLNQKSNTTTHTVMIFEDISTALNNANQVKLNNFLYQSRHENISIIIVTHNLRHAFKHLGNLSKQD